MASGGPPPSPSPPPPSPPPRHAYPKPFVVSPVGPHTHTLIMLHGRGDSGPSFGSGIYIATPSSGFSLPALYPGLKFVFPTTALRYSSAFHHELTEWFETASLTFPEEQGHMQREGLREAVEHVGRLIDAEVRGGIAERNIILGGISQGCATALHVLLAERRRLGGFIGMSGWLPFASNIRSICNLSQGAGLRRDGGSTSSRAATSDAGSEVESENEADDDPGGALHQRPAGSPRDQTAALVFVRENLELPPPNANDVGPTLDVLKTPVFLGHGDDDQLVEYKLGRNIYSTLKHGLGMDVTWKRYKNFGHWYKEPDEIDDIVDFWGAKCGLLPE